MTIQRISRAAVYGLLLGASAVHAGDWRQFRGSDTSAVADTEAPPTKWSANENVAWQVDLPGRGLSSPIIVGDRVFVTASSGYRQERLHVLAFDVASGELVWERQFQATGRTGTHPKTSVAAPTPASDGTRIFAFFSSNDLVCLDLDGQLLWYRGLTHDYPNVSNSLGMSSSPVVIGETLVVQAENDSQSLAFGINTATGESRWTQERPKKANWTSPIILSTDGGQTGVVVLQSSTGLHAIDPLSGEVKWTYADGASTIPSSVAAGGIVYAPSNGITAIKPLADSAGPEIVWTTGRVRPGTASPLVYNGKLYTLNNAGVVVCASLDNGDVAWQLRLEGPFSGSPVAAAGYLFAVNEKGMGFVVKPGENEGEIVSENDLGETILCTPAIADNAIFVRSDSKLWKIAAK